MSYIISENLVYEKFIWWWKLTLPSKVINEKGVMHSKSNNIEIMINNDIDEIMEEHFWSLHDMHQLDLEESTSGSKFVLHLLMNCITSVKG